MEKLIYMDHAATTPVDRRVLDAMTPFLAEHFGSASTIYAPGRKANDAVETAREQVASLLNAAPEEIYFTSGGTESDNLALQGTAFREGVPGNHIITSKVEHHAILHTCEFLEKRGINVTYLDVDREGFIDPDDVQKAIADDTILVSIMHANNEVGAIEPIEAIAKITNKRGIAFHTDAVQTAGKIATDVDALGVDMFSLSGHKLYAPKGTGALYVRKGTTLAPIFYGGGHERKLRSGTHNVAGIVALGTAAELAKEEMADEAARLTGMHDRIIDFVLKEIPKVTLTGPREKRLPGYATFTFEAAEGEAMLLRLDLNGICASSGSACTTGSLDPSHVLIAMGIPPEVAHGSLRVTLGRDNTDEDVDRLLQVLPESVQAIRAMSPVWDGG